MLQKSNPDVLSRLMIMCADGDEDRESRKRQFKSTTSATTQKTRSSMHRGRRAETCETQDSKVSITRGESNTEVLITKQMGPDG